MSLSNPSSRVWLMLTLLVIVIVGAMFALMLIAERSIEEGVPPPRAADVGEPRNNILVDQLDRTPSVSRDYDRNDPLSAALDYSEHMNTFEPPTPTPVSTPTPVAVEPVEAAASGDPTAEQWADLRNCEAQTDLYLTNTGNGYYGAYQFDLSTWQSVGGTGLPSDASPEEQDMRALMLYHASGAGPWPVCGKYLY